MTEQPGLTITTDDLLLAIKAIDERIKFLNQKSVRVFHVKEILKLREARAMFVLTLQRMKRLPVGGVVTFAKVE